MPERMKKTDVVIVGLGAAGGIAAYVLTQAGLDVVGLEAGGRLTGQDEPPDELAAKYNVFGLPKANHEIPTWRPNESTPTLPGTIGTGTGVGVMMNAVGGTSIHYGTESWRLAPYNFRERSHVIARYGASAIPAGSTLADWPMTYADLEPYYDNAEYLIGISGKAGNIRGKIRAGGNPFEGPRSREYPLPPLRRTGFTDLGAATANKLGWHPFPGPSANHSKAWKGTRPCTYCSQCGNGCWISAKGSTDIHAIPEAEKTKHLSVVTFARVTQINTNSHGRVTGVTYLRGGKEFFQPASVVLVGAFVYENVRLLLLSQSKAYPNGLSNNHAQVGQNYMAHNTSSSIGGLFPGQKLNRFNSINGQSTNIDDWADDNFDHTGLGFIGGGTFKWGMGASPIGSAGTLPPSAPTWGTDYKTWLAANANSVATINAQDECAPYEANYLDLDPTARDRLGLPVLRITFNLYQNEITASAFLAEKLSAFLMEAGASETWPIPGMTPGVAWPPPVTLAVHAYGGLRMGNDPDTSVVDKWCFSHEAPNLGVLGGAVMPTQGSRNPTLTLQAIAWRTADHLVKNWKAIAE